MACYKAGNLIPQQQLAEHFIKQAEFSDPRQEGSIQRLFERTLIHHRQAFNSDLIFHANPKQPIRIEERTELFFSTVPQLIQEFARQHLAYPPEAYTHIITVTCTGLKTPNLEVILPEKLGLSTKVERHAITFSGCYAAIPALRLADTICQAKPDSKVLIIAAEWCSLHFQSPPRNQDAWLSHALFSDGIAVATVSGEAVQPNHSQGIQLEQFASEVVPNTSELMTWQPGDNYFWMQLSKDVPEAFRKAILPFAQSLLPSEEEDISAAQLAIHPGGRRILECFTEEASLSKEQVMPSYKVLKQFGNMSSTTLFYIMEELLNNQGPLQEKTPFFGFAFGPGLSLYGMRGQIFNLNSAY